MKLSITEQISIAQTLLAESVKGEDEVFATLQNLTVMSLMSLIEVTATSVYKPRAIDFRLAGTHNKQQVWLNAIRNHITETSIEIPEITKQTPLFKICDHYQLGPELNRCFDGTNYARYLETVRFDKAISYAEAIVLYHKLILADGMVLRYKLTQLINERGGEPMSDADITEYMYQNFNKVEK